MSLTKFVLKLIAKIGLIAGIIFLVIGSFAVESDMGFAVKTMIIGMCFVAPDIIMQIIEGIYADEK